MIRRFGMNRSNKKKNIFSQFFRTLFFQHDRSLKCMGISMICHCFIIAAVVLFLLPKGDTEGDYVTINFSSGEASEVTDAVKKTDAKDAEEQESKQDKDQTYEEVKKNVEKLQNFDPGNSPEIKEYLQERAEMLASKRKKMASLKGKNKAIQSNLKYRSKYGILRPRTFYDIDFHYRNLLFVYDISGSMDIQEARVQLKNAYNSLEKGEFFNIIAFNHNILSWQESLVDANEENKKMADQWVDKLYSGGGTNIYSALEKAFEVSQKKPRTQVIFFVSDGLSGMGPVRNPFGILKAVRLWNSEKSIIIHTIGIGRHQDVRFLSALAEQNRGRYHRR